MTFPGGIQFYLLLVLGAEVERNDGWNHDHHIIGCDSSLAGKNDKYRDYRKGYNGLYLDQCCQIFDKFHYVPSLFCIIFIS